MIANFPMAVEIARTGDSLSHNRAAARRQRVSQLEPADSFIRRVSAQRDCLQKS